MKYLDACDIFTEVEVKFLFTFLMIKFLMSLNHSEILGIRNEYHKSKRKILRY